MKKIQQLSAVLSWINLFAGSLLVLGGLMITLMSPGVLGGLLSIVLTGSIILHSVAALQLRKSILYPSIPLSSQVPTGLRLMGFIALFFAVMSISSGIMMLEHAPETAKLIKLPIQYKSIDLVISLLRISGIVSLFISICIITNVALNFRLLKWYLFYRNEGKK